MGVISQGKRVRDGRTPKPRQDKHNLRDLTQQIQQAVYSDMGRFQEFSGMDVRDEGEGREDTR
ncbi:hypothetical protein N7497_000361 [Penicillium chrysogenum]|nr:hypothetical protein N7497_000361 [Penicillium chrysogenum]